MGFIDKIKDAVSGNADKAEGAIDTFIVDPPKLPLKAKGLVDKLDDDKK